MLVCKDGPNIEGHPGLPRLHNFTGLCNFPGVFRGVCVPRLPENKRYGRQNYNWQGRIFVFSFRALPKYG